MEYAQLESFRNFDRFNFLLFFYFFYCTPFWWGRVRAHDTHLKWHFRIHICVHLQSLFGQYITVVFVHAELICVYEQLRETAEDEN
jgi:hypothetical protein